MYSVSPEFKATVRGSHEVTVRAEVWRSGVFLRSIEVLEGSVDVDARRAQRRTCTLRVAATKPTVQLTPVWNTYASIRGAVVTWDLATSTWDGAGTATWDEGNEIPSTAEPGEYNDYQALAAAYPNYASLQQIASYDEVTVDDGLIPTSAFSDVAPFGNELLLWRGINIPDKPQYYTYGDIKGLRMTWDLLSPSLTWATVDSAITWQDGNDLPPL
jgi:hypothetical protein